MPPLTKTFLCFNGRSHPAEATESIGGRRQRSSEARPLSMAEGKRSWKHNSFQLLNTRRMFSRKPSCHFSIGVCVSLGVPAIYVEAPFRFSTNQFHHAADKELKADGITLFCTQVNRALSLQQQGNYADAAADFDAAIAEGPVNWQRLWHRATCLAELGKPYRASAQRGLRVCLSMAKREKPPPEVKSICGSAFEKRSFRPLVSLAFRSPEKLLACTFRT